MSENYSFRSAINGFNRNDVIAYIEDILKQQNSDNSNVEELEHKLSMAEEKIESLSEALEKAHNENGKLCSQAEISKVYEARLGAAMLDAKRFSEILVQEANDKASGLFTDALSSADQTLVKADEIIENIKKLKENFNTSFDFLINNLENICSSIEAFKSDVESTGGMFNFSSDFMPVGDELDKKIRNKMAEEDKNKESSMRTDDIKSDISDENEVSDRIYSVQKKNESQNNVSADEIEIKVDIDE